MKNKSIHFLFPVILLFFSTLIVRSQDVSQYNGPYRVGEYQGTASFGYRLQEQDTILEGPFKMQRSNLNALVEDEDTSFSMEGAFENDYPEGNWTFQFGEYQTDRQTEVVDYQYRVLISGIQHLADGFIKLGKPDGSWVYRVDRIERSEVQETLFDSQIEFENGIPQRSFRIENSQSTLLGRCLRNGLAHDEWTLFSKDGESGSESWFFSNGLLQSIQVEKDGLTEVSEVFSAAGSRDTIIELDARFLSLLQLKRTLEPGAETFKSTLYSLLKENGDYYDKINQILTGLGQASFKPGFKVNVPYFPLTQLEKSQLDSIEIAYKKAFEKGSALLADTQLNILKLSDEQSAYLYAALQAIEAELFEPLGQLVQYNEEGLVDLISREELFENLWPASMPVPELRLDDAAQNSFKGPNADQYDFSSRDLSAAHKMAEYSRLSVDSIQLLLKDKLKQEKSRQDLTAIEEGLIKENNQLQAQIDSLRPIATNAVKEALTSIESLASDQLSDYAALEDVDTKIDKGRTLLNCLEDLQRLSRAIGLLPAQQEEISELYMDAIWQPFISVVMNEEVKKRITTAYRRIAKPYLLDRVSADLNCDNAAELSELLENLYKRMIEMREEDTARLERKLKRENDPEVVLDLFGVKSKNEE